MLAKELGLPPSSILEWRESEFFLWLAVSRDVKNADMLEESIAISYSVWSPGKLTELFKDREDPMSHDEVQEALDKAERYKKEIKWKETT